MHKTLARILLKQALEIKLARNHYLRGQLAPVTINLTKKVENQQCINHLYKYKPSSTITNKSII